MQVFFSFVRKKCFLDYDASHLWIMRAGLAVDYAADAAVDFPALRARAHISDASHLWISQRFVLGRIYPGFALWISGGGGLASPPHPSGRTEFCILLCSWGRGDVKKVQGDTAPCRTTLMDG